MKNRRASFKKMVAMLSTIAILLAGLPMPIMEADAGSTVAFTDKGGANQQWTFEDVELYRIKNVDNGEYLAVVYDGGMVAKTAALGGDIAVSSWRITASQGVGDQINLSNINDFMLNSNGSTTDAQLSLTDIANGKAQGTTCFTLSGGTAAADQGQYSIDLINWYKQGTSEVSLSVDGDGKAVLAPKNSDGDKQKWVFERVSKAYTIKNASTGNYLTGRDANPGGSPAATAEATATTDGYQYWRIVDNAEGGYLANVRTSGYLKAKDAAAGTSSGASFDAIATWDATDNGLMQWNGTAEAPSPVSGSSYTIDLRSDYKLAGDKTACLTDMQKVPPVAFTEKGGVNQQWTFEDVELYRIKNVDTEKYLSVVDDNGMTAKAVDLRGDIAVSSWRITASKGVGDQINLSNINSSMLNSNGSTTDAQLSLTDIVNGEAQGTTCFTLSGGTTAADQGQYTIDLLNWYKQGTSAVSLSVDSNGKAILAPKDSGDNKQQWVFERIPKVYTIKNATTGNYLTGRDANPSGNPEVTVEATPTDDGYQYWRIVDGTDGGYLANVHTSGYLKAKDATAGTAAKALFAAIAPWDASDNALMQLNGAAEAPSPVSGSSYTIDLRSDYKLAGDKTASLTDMEKAEEPPVEEESPVSFKKLTGEDDQKWQFVEMPFYRVKNKDTNEYLSWDGTKFVTAASNADDMDQLWRFAATETPFGASYINMINFSGRLIAIDSAQPNNMGIYSLPPNGEAMMLLSGTANLAPADNSEFSIDVGASWLTVNDNAQSLSVDNHIVKFADRDSSNVQKWVFEKVTDKYYRVQNKKSENFLAIINNELTTTEYLVSNVPPVYYNQELIWKLIASENPYVTSVNLVHAKSEKLVGITETSPYDLTLSPGLGGGSLMISGAQNLAPTAGEYYTITTLDGWYDFGGGAVGALTEYSEDEEPPAPAVTPAEFQGLAAAKLGQKWTFEAYTYNATAGYRIKNTDSLKYLTFNGTDIFTTDEVLEDGSQAWEISASGTATTFQSVNIKNIGNSKIITVPGASGSGIGTYQISMGTNVEAGESLMQLNGVKSSIPAIEAGTAYTINTIDWYKLDGAAAVLTDPTAQPEEEKEEALDFAAVDSSSKSQSWTFTQVEYYRIKNKSTNKYLAWNGTSFATEAGSSSDSQLWSISLNAAAAGYINISGFSGAYIGSTIADPITLTNSNADSGGACLRLSDQYIKPANNGEYTIDIIDWYKISDKIAALSLSGDTPQLAVKNGTDTKQVWIFEKATNHNYYTIQNVATGGNLTYAGDEIKTMTSIRSDGSQNWKVEVDSAKNALSIINYKTGKRLGSNAATASDETYKVRMNGADSDNDTYFLLDGAATTAAPALRTTHTLTLLDTYKIGTKLAALNDLAQPLPPERFIYTPAGSRIALSTHASNVWSIESADDGDYVLIKDTLSHKYITVSGGKLTGSSATYADAQLWLREYDGTRTLFKNKETGTYLALKASDQSAVLSATKEDSAKWTYTGDKMLRNAWTSEDGTSYYLQMFISDSTAEGTLAMEITANKKSQQYALIEVKDGSKTYYKLQSAWSEKYLTSVDDIRVEERAAADDDTQLWEFKEMASGTFVAINIVNKGNGLGIALVDPFNMDGGTNATLKLVSEEQFTSGFALWYFNGSRTINTKVRSLITSLYPTNTTITSRGTEVIQPPPPISNRTIYVSAAGSDSNTGLSENQAIKSIDKLNEMIKGMTPALTAGDTIKFRKGDTFTGEVQLYGNRGTEEHRITITSYGTASANPKIIAPDILTKAQVEAMLAADPDCGVKYNSSKNLDTGIMEIRNGIIRSSILVEGCDYVTIDGIDAYSSNNAEDFYQFIHDPTGLIHINDATNVVIRNCKLSAEVERRIKDYIADALGKNRDLGPYVDDNNWTASYPPYRGNDFYGISVNNSIAMDNTDMTNVVIENCDMTKLTLGLVIKNSAQFTVKDVLVHDSPCWGISVESSSNGQVLDSIVRNTGYGLNPNGNAAYMVSSSQEIVLDGVEAYNSQRGPQPYDGVAVDFEGGINQRDITIRNAIIDGVDGAAIMIFGNTDGNKDFVIDNVFIKNYGRSGNAKEGALNFISFEDSGIWHYYGSGLVVNTTIVANVVNGTMMPYYTLTTGGQYPDPVANVLFIDCNFTTGVDKTAIKTLIDKVSALKESDYTADSWAQLKQALENAKYAYESNYMSETVVNEMMEALQAAVDALVLKDKAPENPTSPTDSSNPSDSGNSSGGNNSGSSGGSSYTPSNPNNQTPDGTISGNDELTLEKLLEIISATDGDIVTIKTENPPIITTAMWNALVDAGKGLRIQVVNSSNLIEYAWTFTDIIRDSADFDTAMIDSANLSAINGLLGSQNAQIIAFKYRGTLPGKVQLIVKNTAGFQAGNVLILQAYNEETGKLENVGKVSVSSDGGYLAFELTEASDYVVTKSADSQKTNNTPSDDTADEDGNNTLVIVLISVGGGILLIGAGLLLFFLLKRRKKDKDE